MGRARSLSHSTRSATAALALASATAHATPTRVLPALDGHAGAFLLAGPFLPAKSRSAPARTLDTPIVRGSEGLLQPMLRRSVDPDTPDVVWQLLSSEKGPLDLAAELHLGAATDAFALLAGVLHLASPLSGAMFVGASDGLKVYVDGSVVDTREEHHLFRDDERLIPLSLSAGDHRLLFKLRHRDGAGWPFRFRLTDGNMSCPEGAYLELPGTSAGDSRALFGKMAHATLHRGAFTDGYYPSVTVTFPEGAPGGVSDRVEVTLTSVSTGPLPGASAWLTPRQIHEETIVPVPPLTGASLAAVEAAETIRLVVEIAKRTLTLPMHPHSSVRAALRASTEAEGLCNRSSFLVDPASACDTVRYLADRIARRFDQGDPDVDALREEATTVRDYVDDMKRGRDPLHVRAGVLRLAYLSPIDATRQPFGLYVPPSYVPEASRKYPLVVALHGLNGRPLTMIRWFFGQDQVARDVEWEDRHEAAFQDVEGFVLAPFAFGNSMYREQGEADVMHLIEWVIRNYPIDSRRVSITGLSMGGTGAAAIAFRHPDMFSALEPLCGYQSYFVRNDLAGKPLMPWEKLLAEHRSPASWAENGTHLPLYVWHGTLDQPVRNSGILIDRYKELGFAVREEHPVIGHEVWRKAYEQGQAFAWLSSFQSPEHPAHVFLKTDHPRYAKSFWAHIDQLSGQLAFGTLEATVRSPTHIDVRTKGVDGFTFDRDPSLIDSQNEVTLQVNGAPLSIGAGSALSFHREGTTFAAGPSPPIGKRAGLSGPIRDAFLEPLIFVYGTGDPTQTRANQEVAQAFRAGRWGLETDYPILPDSVVDDTVAARSSLFLVGNARSNRIVGELDSKLPFHVEGDVIRAGGRRWRGRELGVAFIYPNPAHPDRYVVVIEGTTAFGTFRATSLPELLPDWVIYDQRVGPARGGMIVAPGSVQMAGFFNNDWSLPTSATLTSPPPGP